jgi:hypothetical protein
MSLPGPVFKVSLVGLSFIRLFTLRATNHGEVFFTVAIYSRSRCDLFLPLTVIFVLSMLLLSHAHCLFTFSPKAALSVCCETVMARVRSTSRPCDDVTAAGGEGAVM